MSARFAHYELQSRLGKGGMGEVFRAHDTRMGRQVALKLLPDDIAADPRYRRRFDREAKVVAALRHPNIVTVHQFGTVDGQMYIDMALIDGMDLGKLIRSAGRLDPARALRLLRQAASALDAAHAAGLVHRDVKPTNLMVHATGHVYLIDFGVARADRPRDSSDGTAGTFTYMAPEHAAGGALPASDVYALTCVLYECVVGEPPFTGGAAQVYGAHLAATPPRPGAADGALTPLDGVVAKGMAKNAEDRYATATDLVDAAEQALLRARATTAPATPADTTATVEAGARQMGRSASPITVGSRPGAVALDGRGRAYVAVTGEGTLAVVDTAGRRVVATVPVGPAPMGLAVVGGTVYVAVGGRAAVAAVDVDTLQVRAAVPVGRRPWGVACDPAGEALLVANRGDDTVSFVDLRHHAPWGTVRVGRGPTDVAVDPHSRAAYVTNHTDGTVSVVDTARRLLVATIPVGAGPWRVAVNPGDEDRVRRQQR